MDKRNRYKKKNYNQLLTSKNQINLHTFYLQENQSVQTAKSILQKQSQEDQHFLEYCHGANHGPQYSRQIQSFLTHKQTNVSKQEIDKNAKQEIDKNVNQKMRNYIRNCYQNRNKTVQSENKLYLENKFNKNINSHQISMSKSSQIPDVATNFLKPNKFRLVESIPQTKKPLKQKFPRYLANLSSSTTLRRIQLDLIIPTPQNLHKLNQKQKQKIYLKQMYMKKSNIIKSQIKLKSQLWKDNISYHQFNDNKQKISLAIHSQYPNNNQENCNEENGKQQNLFLTSVHINNRYQSIKQSKKKYVKHQNNCKQPHLVRELVQDIVKKNMLKVPEKDKQEIQVFKNQYFKELVQKRLNKAKFGKSKMPAHSHQKLANHGQMVKTFIKFSNNNRNDNSYEYFRMGYREMLNNKI